ncbi:adenosylcobinamide-GDP ribazoletransferase [Chondrinema litorale]|uniref:adenosylcobinamide-GDP ribazoletransferase n=1 Tax=Chondrinema litorale TaxID=2994555 RepID=UPI00254287F9|nr:adenosylcobinamide-GDP ribazoletransferase [Chondrinema litorale]UZR99675.1 adenosylcobinamide-GDP ribazoletransferase [Chondrinema litorale]
MIRKEIRYFFTALMFFTRIPCPTFPDYKEEYLNKSRKYFPLIGWVVGGIAASVLLAFSYILPITVSVLLSVIAGVWVTGAFHEDGFADICDAFGGGWTKEQILRIMKDSRVGAFGAIGIFLIVLIKIFALIEIAQLDIWLTCWAILNGHTCSRFVASTFVHSHEYVQDIDKSKSKPIANNKLSFAEMFYSFVIAILPLFLSINWWYLLAFPIAYLPKIYLGYFFNKFIGGYTGDCLGATQQVSEVVFYLSILGIWKFI